MYIYIYIYIWFFGSARCCLVLRAETRRLPPRRLGPVLAAPARRATGPAAAVEESDLSALTGGRAKAHRL